MRLWSGLPGALLLAGMAAPALADTAVAVGCGGQLSAGGFCMNEVAAQPDRPWQWTTLATAFAGHGVLKARASAHGELASPTSAGAVASFSDRLVIEATDPDIAPGATARVSFDAWLDYQGVRTLGTFSGAGDRADTGFHLQFDVLGAAAPFQAIAYENTSISSQDLDANFSAGAALAPLTFDIVLGQAFVFRVELATSASISGNAAAVADAGQSFYWGGLASLTDTAGQPIAYRMVSDTGTDWSQSFAPVPEASTLALWTAGLLLLGAGVRRRAPVR